MIHNNDYSKMWFNIPWKRFERITFQLQKRIYEARKENDLVKVKALQKILFNAYSTRMLAIRQVTQLNSGKKMAGIDGKSYLTHKQRFLLEEELSKNGKHWKHMALRQIPIIKSDETKSFLKIPTIKDRVWQCLVQYVLEPAHEAEFHPRNYGFRPGRSPHDIQKMIFCHLNSKSNGYSKRIITLDVEQCFDGLSHSFILNHLIAPAFIKNTISNCLKIGNLPEFPEEKTVQGSVISPLLANIALNGIETIHASVKYGNVMLFFLKPGDNEKTILSKINKFLEYRGMHMNKKKIRITKAIDGFNYLGWHFQVLTNKKFKCHPSKNNYIMFKKKVKAIVLNPSYGSSTKSAKIEPIVRAWRNYHKYCDMSKQNLWMLNNATWKNFMKESCLTKKEASKLIKSAFPSISYSCNKFVNVKLDKSLYDGDFIYWSKRNSKKYDGLTSTVLEKQSHRCKYCGLFFLGDQQVNLHHNDSNHNNWELNNLIAVHKSCHQKIHHDLHTPKEIPNKEQIGSYRIFS